MSELFGAEGHALWLTAVLLALVAGLGVALVAATRGGLPPRR
ncbi:hypothetical protein [Actinoplanes sp. L3-i22]|nr:hypothetical protein [Actinoplanes sp. L3-i22]BCY12525.1 hypothetical protein L3i22_076130 [Actinoplanes sp. L3-i22]